MLAPETARARLAQKIAEYQTLAATDRKGLNENATRQGFILPLFAALGWEIENVREVSPEERVSRGWVDFAFRLDGIPKFFLETKRAGEDLNNPRWVQQAIDYAWHKNVPWAVLTDFEHLRVFNAEWQERDPFRAQFLEFRLDTYLSDFDRLWWLSKPAVQAGVLDREAEKVGRKTRRVPVTEKLFQDLKTWRHELFRHWRIYNKTRSLAEIDEAVLRMLNRLIFIRTAEDRLVEPPTLLPLVRELTGQRRYNELPQRLGALFRQMDTVYNSELFAPHFSEDLECEPAPLEALITGLYERNYVRYNFNAIDADVLGTVYEQYLGHVVAAGAAEAAATEAADPALDKRAKRKNQGIYYTPTFIVHTILQHTLGRHLETANPARPVRVLDLACGSGSFLIAAFDWLDRHLAPTPALAHDHTRAVHILTECLYGVDKDPQAVEVARLNLLLRSLHARARLPYLDHLRMGDSLLAAPPDTLKQYFGKNWKAKHPLQWEAEFPEAMQEDGFDVVVGNPPYVRPHNLPAPLKTYLRDHYASFVAKSDLYCCFIQRAIDLAKPGGFIGLIVSNGWLRLDSFQGVRQYILEHCKVLALINLPEKVFADAMVRTGILVLQKEPSTAARTAHPIEIWERPSPDAEPRLLRTIPQNTFATAARQVFDVALSAEFTAFKTKVEAHHPRWHEVAEMRFGLKTGDDAKFIHRKPKTRKHKPLLRGAHIHRYHLQFAGEYVWYDPRKMREHKTTARPGEAARFEQEKILVRDTGAHLECVLDTAHYYAKDVLIVTRGAAQTYDLAYLTGVLNSKLMRVYYETSFPTLHVQNSELALLPICLPNLAHPAEKKRHNRLVTLVQHLLDLHRDLATTADLSDQRALQRQIATTDQSIDQVVYELYGLTEAEVAFVESQSEKAVNSEQ